MLVAIYGTAVVGNRLARHRWAGDSPQAAVASLEFCSGFDQGHMAWFAAFNNDNH